MVGTWPWRNISFGDIKEERTEDRDSQELKKMWPRLDVWSVRKSIAAGDTQQNLSRDAETSIHSVAHTMQVEAEEIIAWCEIWLQPAGKP